MLDTYRDFCHHLSNHLDFSDNFAPLSPSLPTSLDPSSSPHNFSPSSKFCETSSRFTAYYSPTFLLFLTRLIMGQSTHLSCRRIFRTQWFLARRIWFSQDILTSSSLPTLKSCGVCMS